MLNIHMNQIATKDVHVNSKNMWLVNLVTSKRENITFKIDTGAECSLISQSTYENMVNKPKLRSSNIMVRGLLGTPSKTVGSILLPVIYKGCNYNIKCEVINDPNVPNILSDNDSLLLNLVQRVNRVHSHDKSDEIVQMRSTADFMMFFRELPKFLENIP